MAAELECAVPNQSKHVQRCTPLSTLSPTSTTIPCRHRLMFIEFWELKCWVLVTGDPRERMGVKLARGEAEGDIVSRLFRFFKRSTSDRVFSLFGLFKSVQAVQGSPGCSWLFRLIRVVHLVQGCSVLFRFFKFFRLFILAVQVVQAVQAFRAVQAVLVRFFKLFKFVDVVQVVQAVQVRVIQVVQVLGFAVHGCAGIMCVTKAKMSAVAERSFYWCDRSEPRSRGILTGSATE